jgi:hypothetical protein
LIALQKAKKAQRHNAAGETMRGIIAANLSKGGWSWGCVSTVHSQRANIFIAGAHRENQRFVVRADELLTAFWELERAVRLGEESR